MCPRIHMTGPTNVFLSASVLLLSVLGLRAHVRKGQRKIACEKSIALTTKQSNLDGVNATPAQLQLLRDMPAHETALPSTFPKNVS